MNNQHLQQARQLPIQEDFYLLDVIGGTSFSAVHPTRPVVAYTSGCMIIVYDLMTDQKFNLVHHQHEIYALAFSPPGAGNSQTGGDFLISIDFDRNDINDIHSVSCSTMCLWNWQNGQCLQEVQIPRSSNNGTFLLQANIHNSSLPRLIQIAFEKVGGHFFVLESGSSEMGGGYRATLWNLNRQQRLEMQSQLELELQQTCQGLYILPKSSISSQQPSLYSSQSTQYMNNRMKFLTLEKQCIKIWEYIQGHAELCKRIMIKQPIKQCVVSELTGYLIILGDNGKLLILDQEGEFVSSIHKDHHVFTVIGTAHDKLLLGTEKGTICVYHMASLQFISEVPYQLSLLKNFQLNGHYQSPKKMSPKKYGNHNRNQEENDELTVYKIGPPVQQVQTTSNNRFLFIKYSDSSFVMLDRSVPTQQQAIMGYQFGHFQKVSSLQWLSKQSKRPLIQDTSLHSSTQTSNTFITASNDMSIFIWKHFGDRWSFSFIDVVKCFDNSLSYQRKNTEKSTQNLGLCSLCLYPKQAQLVVGDTQGVLRVFQISGDKALFVASHQLLKGLEVAQTEDAIVEIYITQDEQYAIIAFESGLICCYDVKNSYNFIGQIEKDAQRFCYANQLQIQHKIIENSPDNQSSFDFYKRQDEKPYNTSFDLNMLSKPFYSSFRVLSTTSPNCVSLRQIEVKGNKLYKTPLVQFTIDEGKVSGFDIHPSKDYVLITSTQGRIYVYRIDTGELRGTLKIPLHSKGCLIDPSGLYVVISVPPFKRKHTANIGLYGDQQQNDDDFNNGIGTHENDIERTTLLMFEIGTGMPAAEIKSIFEITSIQFSEDGKYLALGSKKGTVCVWAVGEHLYQNIKQVMDSMVYQPDFWANYPIFLPDYGQYGIESLPLNLMNNIMPVENQIDTPDNYQLLQQSPQQVPIHYPQTSQKLTSQPNYQNSASKSLQYSPHIQPLQHNQGLQTEPSPQQFRSQVVPPAQKQQIPSQSQQYYPSNQNYNPYQQKVDRSIQGIPSQQQIPLQQQQQKFYRKTFVEDQQTQVTPHQSILYQNQQQQQPQIYGQRQAYIQTIDQQQQQQYSMRKQPQVSNQRLPEIPDYGNQYQQPTFNKSPNKQQLNYVSQSSLASPNKAELLYQDPYLQQPIKNTQRVLPVQSMRSFQPYQQQLSSSPVRAQQPPQLDYIDRTTANYKQPIPQTDRPIFYDDNPHNNNMLTYEENLDAAQLYNPIPLSSQQNLPASFPQFIGSRENPLPVKVSPIKEVNFGGIIKSKNDIQKPVIKDPIDIDDDVSDHGPESIHEQLKQLDGMNKYLQHVRVPTRFANDGYMASMNGQNAERAYTLERLRQEEKMIDGGVFGENKTIDEEGDNRSSTYDLVEEMYENMNSFDKKIKSQQQQQYNNNFGGYPHQQLYF